MERIMTWGLFLDLARCSAMPLALVLVALIARDTLLRYRRRP